ncbi:MAG TPA: AMP-binding protein [Acidimicrobiales bacterium]|nr:AMP-binding protein [Acidimicrobiales bacterium]
MRLQEPTETSFGRRSTEFAQSRPDEIDLVIVRRDGSEVGMAWGVLESRANQIARMLEGLGVTQDSVVALALPTCVEHVYASLAAWKLGAVVAPLRHDLPQWEMDRLVDAAGPAVLVSDVHAAPGPVVGRQALAATTSLPDHALPDRVATHVSLLPSGGSTGTPKLILHPSRGVVDDNPMAAALSADAGVEERTLVNSPLYHGPGFQFVAPRILEGKRVFVMERFDAALAARVIEEKQITYTLMVPTMLQRIAQLDDVGPANFASLRRLVYGGASIPEWVVDRWLELVPPHVFWFSYGSSEHIGLCMMTGEEWADHRGSTGRPVGMEVSIRDEAGNEVPAGTIGEIHQRPPDGQRTFEYVGAPTPEPTADGYYTIGDLGWVDADGYVYIADRRKDLIITGGANVYPAEVETALSEHPAVGDQVVVGVPDPEWGRRVHAIVEPADPNHPPAVDDLRTWCKARLAAYKVPKTYEVVPKLERTDAGKVNRTRLSATRSDVGFGAS